MRPLIVQFVLLIVQFVLLEFKLLCGHKTYISPCIFANQVLSNHGRAYKHNAFSQLELSLIPALFISECTKLSLLHFSDLFMIMEKITIPFGVVANYPLPLNNSVLY